MLPFDKTEEQLKAEAFAKRLEVTLMQMEAQHRASLYLMETELNKIGEWVNPKKPEPEKLKPLGFWDKIRIIFKRKSKKD